MRKAQWGSLLLLCLALGSTADGGRNRMPRTRCEELQAGAKSGQPASTMRHEWATLDCSFWTTRTDRGVETGTYVYRYLGYAALIQRMKALAAMYPSLVRLRTAQERYNLPTAGTCSEDTRGIEKAACRVWILELGAEKDAVGGGDGGAATRSDKPQVLLSGALHGNERIGPTTLVELATLLCGRYGTDPWVTRLLDTRAVVMVPAANAVGYHENKREELGVDPNRDFAFDTAAPNCMRTIAARALNELWRESLFSFAVTFHGGDNLLAFPWGDTRHCPGFPAKCQGGRAAGAAGDGAHAMPQWISPDHTAMAQLAKLAADYAGPEAPSQRLFRHGPLNDPAVIYPVGGGMEDWSYGGSWAHGRVECRPRTWGGYTAEHTAYNDATHRTANLLVETSNVKAPPEIELGHSGGVLLSAAHQVAALAHSCPRGLGRAALRLYIYISIYLHIYLSMYLSMYLSISINTYLYTCV